jgi:hypothetical protein
MATFEATFKNRKKTLLITTKASTVQSAMEEIWDIIGIRPSSLSKILEQELLPADPLFDNNDLESFMEFSLGIKK